MLATFYTFREGRAWLSNEGTILPLSPTIAELVPLTSSHVTSQLAALRDLERPTGRSQGCDPAR